MRLFLAFLAFTIWTTASLAEEVGCGQAIPGEWLVSVSADSPHLRTLSLARRKGKARQIAKEYGDLRWQSSALSSREVFLISARSGRDLDPAVRNATPGVSIIPNRRICLSQESTGSKVRGSVRILGASFDRNPGTIAFGSDESIVSLSPLGVKTEAPLPVGDSSALVVKGVQPTELSFWDPDSNGLPDLFALSKEISCLTTQVFCGSDYAHSASLQNSSRGTFGARAEIEEVDTSPIPIEKEVSLVRDLFVPAHGLHGKYFAVDESLFLVTPEGTELLLNFSGKIQDIADFDGDGWPDVLTTERYENGDRYSADHAVTVYSIYQGVDGLTFDPLLTFEREEMRYDFQDVAATFADFDGDGLLDILVTFEAYGLDNHLALHRFIGNNSFESNYYHVTDDSGEAVPLLHLDVAEVSGDSLPDLVFATELGYGDELHNTVGAFIADSAGGYRRVETLSGGEIKHWSILPTGPDGQPEVYWVVQETTKRLSFLPNGAEPELEVANLFTGTDVDSPLVVVDSGALAGVKVVLESGTQSFTTYSDINGEFVFSGIPNGDYRVSLAREGFDFSLFQGTRVTISGDMDNLDLLGALDPETTLSGYSLPQGGPNDGIFPLQWGLHNVGQLGGRSNIDIDAPEAWDITRGDDGLVVAVVDTGIDYFHPDLAPNLWVNSREIPGNGIDDDSNGVIDDVHGYSAYFGDGDPLDRVGHGTHVAGTIAARGWNDVGVVGVAPNVKLMAIQSLDDGGGSVASVLAGLDYVLNMKKRGVNVRVVNASVGSEDPCSEIEKNVIRDLEREGIIFVAAAGNGGSDHKGDDNDATPFSPANCSVDSLISVANLSVGGQLASSSNFGKTEVHLGAPGTAIQSTYPSGTYKDLQGTSMAAPHVSGIAALLFSYDPSLSPIEVKERLVATSTPLSSLDGKIRSGGMVNAYHALKYVEENPPSGSSTGDGSDNQEKPGKPAPETNDPENSANSVVTTLSQKLNLLSTDFRSAGKRFKRFSKKRKRVIKRSLLSQLQSLRTYKNTYNHEVASSFPGLKTKKLQKIGRRTSSAFRNRTKKKKARRLLLRNARLLGRMRTHRQSIPPVFAFKQDRPGLRGLVWEPSERSSVPKRDLQLRSGVRY